MPECQVTVFDTETGDIWWVEGHHEAAFCIDAVKELEERNVGQPFDIEGLRTEHWWVKPNPTDDERMDRCEASDPEAQAWIRVDA